MHKCNDINLTTTCTSSLTGLYSIIYGTCYVNYVLNENMKNTMNIPYREASKKVLVTQKFVPS
jgi:hypothetical protein